MNSYAYSRNNPLRFVDPDGKTIREAFENSVAAALDFVESSVVGSVNAVFHPIQTAKSIPSIPSSLATQVGDIQQGLSSGNDAQTSYALTSGLLLVGSLGVPQGRLSTAFDAASAPRFIANATIDDYGRTITGTVDLQPTLNRIESGQLLSQFRNDGVEFVNRIDRNGNRLLPQARSGYYREYVHQTPGINNRQGPQRIITGGGGELYYSPDHYKSVIKLLSGKN